MAAVAPLPITLLPFLRLLIYGYVTAIPPSRKIERATCDSVAFRHIAANTHPDDDILAHFRRRFGTEFEQLFVQVLMLAREIGMLQLGKVSVDGSIRARACQAGGPVLPVAAGGRRRGPGASAVPAE